MKNILLMTLLFTSSGVASAAQVTPACYSKASASVENFVEKDYYDENGFFAFECVVAENNKVVICGVGASKGEGAATDTYRVVLNNSCTKSFRVEMIGEE